MVNRYLLKVLNKFLFIPLAILFVGCGHKKPISPPSPPVGKKLTHTIEGSLLQGKGGYFVGDDGYIILYWDFPIKVELSKVYLNNTLLGKTDENTFLVRKEIKPPATFRVVGIRENKPVAEVFIKVK